MKNICNNPSFVYAIEHPLEARARQALIGLIAVLAFAYLYLVGASILNVMARTEAQTRMTTMRDSISSLESKYFELSQALTPESGLAVGLSTSVHAAYVHRPGATALR